MYVSMKQFYLALSAFSSLVACLPKPQSDPVTTLAGGEVIEFNSSCWDTQYWDGPKASKADILTVASKIRGNKECVMERGDDSPYYKYNMGNVNGVRADLLWTLDDINLGVRKVTWHCDTLAHRLELIANSCSAMFGSDQIAIWTVLNACDAYSIEGNKPAGGWPELGKSGVALNVMAGGQLVPDIRDARRSMPYVSFKLLKREDESPVPGYEST
ncbi:unnamed protein product [Periconia digitata]|uniref:Uncharacterized protein n=1 Tax=Periconia digitata TaxID=1303443 RepID=A0A9W4U9R0_9PLEO|nr:unnamed protein product [Periconia digitata]